MLITLEQLCSNLGFRFCAGISMLGAPWGAHSWLLSLNSRSTLLCSAWWCWDRDNINYMSLLSAVFLLGFCKWGPSRPGEGRRDHLPFCLLFISVPTQQWRSSSSWFHPVASFNNPWVVSVRFLWGLAPATEHASSGLRPAPRCLSSETLKDQYWLGASTYERSEPQFGEVHSPNFWVVINYLLFSIPSTLGNL